MGNGRTCNQCGTQDTSRVWPSLDKAAAAAGGIEFTWACPSCAGPEFELAERSLDDLVAAGAVSGSQPSAPTDPGEVRRAGPSARPITEETGFLIGADGTDSSLRSAARWV